MSRDAFLNADGMAPRKVLLETNQGDIYKTGGINIWMAAGTAEAVLTLLVVQLLFSIGLLMGYRSRVCSLALSLFNNSWNLQNDTKMGGGLGVLTVFLLWGAWLPLGDSYSLDALGSHNRHSANNNRLNSGNSMWLDVVERTTEALLALRDRFASVALPLHMAVMYYCCGVVKETEHWNTGNAVLFVVNSGMPTNQPFASIMASLPMLCRLLTYKTYYVETYGGFVLLVPSSKIRMISLALLIPFHLGMHLALDIGMFQPTMMSALILLTPTEACDMLEEGVQAVWRMAVSPCTGSPKKRAVMLPPTERRAETVVGGCLGAAVAAAMVLVVVTLATNDLCLHLGRVTGGKRTCWLGIGKPYPASIRRWTPILGLPQCHSPFQNIQTDEDCFHIVGLVEDRGALAEDGNSGVCKSGEEKAAAIFTDKTASQLNFDDSILWSPDQNPHANQRWQKFFINPNTREKNADADLADHLCRKWNRRPGHPKVKSIATVRVWKRMVVNNGSLESGPRQYSIYSHFQCTDHGQSGHASNATLIHDKIKEVYGITHMSTFLMNNVRYPLRVYWVHPESGKEIAKGRVREQSRWIQNAEPGHVFKFYWDLPDVPEGSHAEKGLLAQEINVGQTEGKVVLQPKPEWEIRVQNHGQHPLLVYWVHHTTGAEFAKGRIRKHEAWNQKAELGHVSLCGHVLYCCNFSWLTFALLSRRFVSFSTSGSIGIFRTRQSCSHRKSRLTRELNPLLSETSRRGRNRPRMPHRFRCMTYPRLTHQKLLVYEGFFRWSLKYGDPYLVNDVPLEDMDLWKLRTCRVVSRIDVPRVPRL
jgi:hypothetical protein